MTPVKWRVELYLFLSSLDRRPSAFNQTQEEGHPFRKKSRLSTCFVFRSVLHFFPIYDIYCIYIIYRYINTYMHILFPQLFWRISKFRPETSIRGPLPVLHRAKQKPYTLPDKWRLLFFKIPPKKENQVEFFFVPLPKELVLPGPKIRTICPKHRSLHASFGSVVWGGGKFGGGRRLAPTAGPQWHRRSRFARHAREPTGKKKAIKPCGSPFKYIAWKQKGHWIF